MTINLPSHNTCTVAVIGLGYVGLPLAVSIATSKVCKHTKASIGRRVIGFDVNVERLDELRLGNDRTNEISPEELTSCPHLEFTNDSSQLLDAEVFIVTVPTPIDSVKRPDLTPLQKATETVAHVLKTRTSPILPIVIYESTVYPGATEEVCIPIIQSISGLTVNIDFFCGYSPERINPGDRTHKLANITKVTSGSTAESALWIDRFYGSIVDSGTYLAPSIKVAEAAKVIENTQRDLNIALVNELAIIFRHLDIDTLDVLEAAATKWNFLPFRPGLVGGHCIGVDPYYLTHKAEELGYHPQVVLAGRRINDGMSKWCAEQLVLCLAKQNLSIVGTNVLVLGLSFKENCPDLRNTKSVDLILALESYGMNVHVVDPCIDPKEAFSTYGLNVSSSLPTQIQFGAIVAAVAHQEFVAINSDRWRQLLSANGVIFDLKGFVPRDLKPLRI